VARGEAVGRVLLAAGDGGVVEAMPAVAARALGRERPSGVLEMLGRILALAHATAAAVGAA
jgi:hypothetical protein